MASRSKPARIDPLAAQVLRVRHFAIRLDAQQQLRSTATNDAMPLRIEEPSALGPELIGLQQLRAVYITVAGLPC